MGGDVPGTTSVGRGWAGLGIRGRLALVYLAVLVVLLAALGAYFFAGARGALEQSLLDELRSVSTAVRVELDPGAIDAERVAEVAGRTARGETLVVIGERGAVVATGGPPLNVGVDPAWLPRGPVGIERSGMVSDAGGQQFAWVTSALPSHPGLTLVVLTGTGDVDAALGEIGTALLVSLVVAAAAGSLLIWWVTGRALAPVRRLTAASSRMAAGDRSVRVDEQAGADELAELSRAFNRMAAQVEDSVERQRRFVADASHELRTPLTALVGELDVLERADPVTAAELRDAMRRQIGRLSRLVDDLLTLARLDSLGAAALERRMVDLAAIARDVVEEARHAAGGARADIRLAADGAAVVFGDPDALHRALLNVVANGVRHAGAGGVVTVTVSGGPATVTCEVRDTGPGIRPDQLEEVFGRFRRSTSAHDQRVDRQLGDGQPDGGVGLGLSIVRAIVDSHGGSVMARNDPGAVLTLTLPTRGAQRE